MDANLSVPFIKQEDFDSAWDNAFVTETAPSKVKKIARDRLGLDIMEIEAFKVLENQLLDEYGDNWDRLQAAVFRMSDEEIIAMIERFVNKYKE